MAIAAASGACNLHNEGVDAPRDGLSYPQAIALSREDEVADAGNGPDFLYIANTNYDLRYNGGSLQSYDLQAIASALDLQGCRGLDSRAVTDAGASARDNTTYATETLDAGLADGGVSDAGVLGPLGGMDAQISLPDNWTASAPSPRGVLCDGRDPRGDGRLANGTRPATPDPVNAPDCCWDTARELQLVRKAHVSIDSYASGLAVSPDNRRLYVPVESFSRLLYFDLFENGVPDCGIGENERCRRGPGLKSSDDVPGENFPRQIATLAVGKLSDFGAVKTPGEDPTFIATAHELGGFGLFVETNGAPLLEDVVTDLNNRPTSLTFDPRHKLMYVTASALPYFARLGVRVSQSDSYDGERGPRELLYQTSRVTVTGVSQPNDLRDIVLDPYDPDRVWVLIRGTQEAIAILEIDSTNLSSGARLVEEVKIGPGPSKLERINQDGRWFVLSSSYDGKSIFVIDALSHKLDSVIRNLSGPFKMVHDPVRRLLYVTDFRVSTVRVVDVAGLTQRGQPRPRIIATLGDPEFEGAIN
ncbi:MAG TPA: hypothetical protein VFX59_19975 [Polyangiales bacterium]|nr:hypothetical protein [Polyangiales bacterium]